MLPVELIECGNQYLGFIEGKRSSDIFDIDIARVDRQEQEQQPQRYPIRLAQRDAYFVSIMS